MRIRSALARANFSSRKFFELAEQNNVQLLPQTPEDTVLSKYLSLKQQADKSNKIAVTKFKKQKAEVLDYNQLLNGSPYGSVETLLHRNCEITLISTNYFRIDQRKFTRVLQSAKPDILMIQRRPDYHLKQFQLLPKGEDGVFSDKIYLEQLKFTASSLNQTQSLRPIVNAYNKAKQVELESNPEKEILQTRGFDLCKTFASNYTTQMLFGQMPMRSYRQWIANSLTLMQLQQIFKVTCQRLPRYKSLNFTPFQLASLINPDIFLKINDIYMSTLIQMLIATHKYKKITAVLGIVQNMAIKHFLQTNKSLQPLISLLIPPAPKGSLVRDISPLEIVEKHILLDVMAWGGQVGEVRGRGFRTTNEVIEKYAKDIDRKTMMDFRYDKTMEYLKLMEEKIQQGELEIKKEFVRETLRGRA